MNTLIVIKFCINEQVILLKILLPLYKGSLHIFYAESLPVENIVICQTLLKETFL